MLDDESLSRLMLRSVVESDLPIFFEHQRDAEANSMAVFLARTWDLFLSHWQHKVLGNRLADLDKPVLEQLVNNSIAGLKHRYGSAASIHRG